MLKCIVKYRITIILKPLVINEWLFFYGINILIKRKAPNTQKNTIIIISQNHTLNKNHATCLSGARNIESTSRNIIKPSNDILYLFSKIIN